jgi:hypothetical protein
MEERAEISVPRNVDDKDVYMKRLLALRFTLAAFSSLALVLPATASDAIPACIAVGRDLGVNNAQVSGWKHTTRNQFLARAHVHGRLTQIYPVKNGHAHFEIQFDGASNDTLEVVYSLAFGPLPGLSLGMEVEACGDYITSNAATRAYPRSPDDAIIHWIHRNPGGMGHDSGFLVLDGRLFGQGNGSGN